MITNRLWLKSTEAIKFKPRYPYTEKKRANKTKQKRYVWWRWVIGGVDCWYLPISCNNLIHSIRSRVNCPLIFRDYRALIKLWINFNCWANKSFNKTTSRYQNTWRIPPSTQACASGWTLSTLEFKALWILDLNMFYSHTSTWGTFGRNSMEQQTHFRLVGFFF